MGGAEALPLLLGIGLLGGIVGIDQTTVGQTMISRPLVAGTLAGLLLGEPAVGAGVGALMELFHLTVLPVGGARFPESGPAACAGVVAATAVPGAAALGAGVALGLGWAFVGGTTVTLLRRLNGRLVPDPTTDAVTAGEIRWSHLGAIALDFVRAAALTTVGAALGLLLLPGIVGAWPLDAGSTAGLVVVLAVVPLGAIVRILGGWRRHRRLLAAGLAVGAVLALVA